MDDLRMYGWERHRIVDVLERLEGTLEVFPKLALLDPSLRWHPSGGAIDIKAHACRVSDATCTLAQDTEIKSRFAIHAVWECSSGPRAGGGRVWAHYILLVSSILHASEIAQQGLRLLGNVLGLLADLVPVCDADGRGYID